MFYPLQPLALNVPLKQRIRLLGVRAGGLVPLSNATADQTAVQAELPLEAI